MALAAMAVVAGRERRILAAMEAPEARVGWAPIVRRERPVALAETAPAAIPGAMVETVDWAGTVARARLALVATAGRVERVVPPETATMHRARPAPTRARQAMVATAAPEGQAIPSDRLDRRVPREIPPDAAVRRAAFTKSVRRSLSGW